MPSIMNIGIGTALGTGMGAGIAVSLLNAETKPGSMLRPDEPRVQRGVSGADKRAMGMALASPVLIGAGVLGTMSFERPRTVDRFVVDAAEQVSRRTLHFDWSGPAGRYGALVSGLGLTLMSTSVATIS
jgi:hypothetical protein